MPRRPGCINPNFFGEGQFLEAESNTSQSTGSMVCHLTPGKNYYFNIAPAKNYDWTKSSCSNAWCWTTLIVFPNCPSPSNGNCAP